MKLTCFLVFASLSFVFFNISCTSDNEEDLFPECDTLNVTYSNTIYQILEANRCYNCHNSNGTSYNGVIVDNYTGLKAVVDDDRFYNVIHHTPGFTPMPFDGGKIDDCNLAKIRQWIRDGAPDN
jgi:hypothetical protein